MPVAALIPLIQALIPLGVQGISLIGMLIQKWETNGNVTSAEWQAVEEKAKQTASDRLLIQLQAAGIDPNSDTGKALLAATK